MIGQNLHSQTMEFFFSCTYYSKSALKYFPLKLSLFFKDSKTLLGIIYRCCGFRDFKPIPKLTSTFISPAAPNADKFSPRGDKTIALPHQLKSYRLRDLTQFQTTFVWKIFDWSPLSRRFWAYCQYKNWWVMLLLLWISWLSKTLEDANSKTRNIFYIQETRKTLQTNDKMYHFRP